VFFLRSALSCPTTRAASHKALALALCMLADVELQACPQGRPDLTLYFSLWHAADRTHTLYIWTRGVCTKNSTHTRTNCTHTGTHLRAQALLPTCRESARG
jgi:hypothetical protein